MLGMGGQNRPVGRFGRGLAIANLLCVVKDESK
jgi:hypothetical protein